MAAMGELDGTELVHWRELPPAQRRAWWESVWDAAIMLEPATGSRYAVAGGTTPSRSKRSPRSTHGCGSYAPARIPTRRASSSSCGSSNVSSRHPRRRDRVSTRSDRVAFEQYVDALSSRRHDADDSTALRDQRADRRAERRHTAARRTARARSASARWLLTPAGADRPPERDLLQLRAAIEELTSREHELRAELSETPLTLARLRSDPASRPSCGARAPRRLPLPRPQRRVRGVRDRSRRRSRDRPVVRLHGSIEPIPQLRRTCAARIRTQLVRRLAVERTRLRGRFQSLRVCDPCARARVCAACASFRRRSGNFASVARICARSSPQPRSPPPRRSSPSPAPKDPRARPAPETCRASPPDRRRGSGSASACRTGWLAACRSRSTDTPSWSAPAAGSRPRGP